MADISVADSNFKVQTTIDEPDIRFYDVRKAPFQICGVFYENGKFRRLPEAVAETVSDVVSRLHMHTAGGRVRFKTDSSYVAIYAKMSDVVKMPRMAAAGSAGFDLYGDGRYISTFVPSLKTTDGYESVIHFDCGKMREITIHFPLYSGVDELLIGISDRAVLCAAKPYRFSKPIVYYGSSITQGGCASRSGMAYGNILSRRLDADHINLGFSGGAKGEKAITEYISRLNMLCFVYDYDHNAPSVAHLKDTHEKMFKRIRQADPDLPILMMSRPKFYLTEEEKQRLEVIRTTYKNAVKNGDKNVYLIEGQKLMELAGDEGTVDNCHPTDLGFASMAKAVGDVLENILNPERGCLVRHSRIRKYFKKCT